MGRLQNLANRCRLSDADLLGLAREIAMDADLLRVEDLGQLHLACLHALLEMLADQPVESYTLAA